jgi:hypothetical protein
MRTTGGAKRDDADVSAAVGADACAQIVPDPKPAPLCPFVGVSGGGTGISNDAVPGGSISDDRPGAAGAMGDSKESWGMAGSGGISTWEIGSPNRSSLAGSVSLKMLS